MASLSGISFQEKGYIPILHYFAVSFSSMVCCEQLQGKLQANGYMSKVICVLYPGNYLLFDFKYIIGDIKILVFYVDDIFRDLEEYIGQRILQCVLFTLGKYAMYLNTVVFVYVSKVRIAKNIICVVITNIKYSHPL